MAVPALLDLRQKSLLRGGLLVFGSFGAGIWLSDFPNNRATLWLILPTLLSFLGTIECIRCMRRKWSWYHGGVLLLIYADLMVITLLLFFLLYPYAHWLTNAR
ncbi:permease [Terriglobus albidus]|uniref:Permease n=1 Tax=Terriglobus albidus TaxID=1592106 RepID=A0A5B9E943_9BACT|nr:permease [Terriglobus albidus]QEE28742.1 permease [Terriglobus albidus]